MRKSLKIILSKSRILRPLKKLHQNKIVIFNYHRIRDNNKPINFDETVFGPDARRFKKEMEWIKKETRILSEEELINIVYYKKTIKQICSLVTFDDGYVDNFELAYPILKEMKIPAIFFIPTHHLLERKVGWWDVVAYLLKQTSLHAFTFQNKKHVITDPSILIKQFILELKSTDADKIDDYLLNLSIALEVPFPDINLQSAELMTCEQIKILSQNGMTIGSHSHDHSILSKQDSAHLKLQLHKSVQILESVLNKKINSIAYPVGGYEHFNDITKSVSRDVGFKLGFSYLTGVNNCGEIDAFNIKRMKIQPEWMNLDMALAFPDIFLKEKTHLQIL